MYKGIDVSSHQGEINWEKVKKAGKSFAILRMCLTNYDGGIWRIDDSFFQNYEAARKAGLKVGAYVFSYDLTPYAAEKSGFEVSRFIKANGLSFDFPVAYDLEEFKSRKAALRDRGISESEFEPAKLFLHFRDNLTDEAMLYTCPGYIMSYMSLEDMEVIEQLAPVWIADYRNRAGDICPYQREHTMWQYKGDEGRCDGIEGPCDLDNYYGKLEEEKETDWKKKYFELREGIEELLKRMGE